MYPKQSDAFRDKGSKRAVRKLSVFGNDNDTIDGTGVQWDTGTGTSSHHFFTTGMVGWLHTRWMGCGCRVAGWCENE
ncbi:hypothetical protein J2S25_003919 [Mesobacillus stamsii]|uniref:Uncharacterized protein n=1 Tax=Mesobacillus stamsii TaxID=225347 RepID=A0ABU0G2A7_9BACI|nr:hypothetical protein [Mesobacillus stamsii]